MRYKHIIWDWNGTLLDDTRLCVEVLNELLLRRGKSAITEDDYRQNFNFPVINFYKYLGFDTSACVVSLGIMPEFHTPDHQLILLQDT